MLHKLKKRLYFVVAHYFRFWAAIKLRRWHPKIIVVTGSAGKTTLLHLIEAQLGDQAHYSHHANSAYGVPFDILGLHGVERSRWDWLELFVKAPFKAFTRVYKQSLYVVECDADRPGEGLFLANLLKPNVTMWVSALHTHAAQYDEVVGKQFEAPEDAIASEYGNLVAQATELVMINGDNDLMVEQAKRSKAKVLALSIKDLKSYELGHTSTTFAFNDKKYMVPALVPKVTFYQLAMVDKLLDYLGVAADEQYKQFHLPPGRSNVFKGIKDTAIIDSTYNNSNIDSLTAVVELFEQYPAKHKWLIIGDMLEQGNDEEREHRKIAALLEDTHVDRIFLVGPRTAKYTLPRISEALKKRTKLESFERPAELKQRLASEIQGGETMLFKGIRYLEGIIESLLADKNDAKLLVRRDPLAAKRRAAWGL